MPRKKENILHKMFIGKEADLNNKKKKEEFEENKNQVKKDLLNELLCPAESYMKSIGLTEQEIFIIQSFYEKALTQNNWISIKNQLPEDDQKVIVTQFDGNANNYPLSDYPERVWIARFQLQSGLFWTYGSDMVFDKISQVKFWMPIPESPKEMKL